MSRSGQLRCTCLSVSSAGHLGFTDTTTSRRSCTLGADKHFGMAATVGAGALVPGRGSRGAKPQGRQAAACAGADFWLSRGTGS